MGKIELLSGNRAVAYGAKMSRVQVVSAYPITPQTPIVEYLAESIAKGEIDAEYIHPEGEHSAIAAALGAALGGVRSFTATSSQGFGYGYEIIAQAPSYRQPFVMVVANRTLGWYWSLRPDYSDSMTARDLGWIQMYVESVEEAFDAVIQMYKIIEHEKIQLPGMVMLDGFYLSHATEPVNIPDQSEVDDFLPLKKLLPHVVDPSISKTFGDSQFLSVVELHTTYRRIFEETLERAKGIIKGITKEYAEKFKRDVHGLVEEYRTDDADALLVTMGSMTTAARRAVDRLRDKGAKVGLVRVRFYRPFPAEEIQNIVQKEGVTAIGVVDRSISHGTWKGPLALDVASALYGLKDKSNLIDFIAGMGGDDVRIEDYEKMLNKLLEATNKKSICETEFIEHRVKPESPPRLYKNVLRAPGTNGCWGCTAVLNFRHVVDVLGKNTTYFFPPHCLSVCHPVMANPRLLANFAAGAGYARGLYRAYKVRGSKVRVVTVAGDGGTVDIGLQSLSSAAEAGESILFICYDNEAYMNTGIQRSGSTPLGAWTTTTPTGSGWKGKKETPKDMLAIMIAHRVPYIAFTSPAYIHDMKSRIEKAAKAVDNDEGLAYLHMFSPCPPGWRFHESKSVEIARLAVLTGTWPLVEVDHGMFKLTYKPKELLPVEGYLKLQGRFAHLTKDDIGKIQEFVNERYKGLLALDGKKLF